MPDLYVTGQEIEYANGITALVEWAAHEGTNCACGAFILSQGGMGFALCYLDLENEDEEFWEFADEAAPWLPSLEAAKARYFA